MDKSKKLKSFAENYKLKKALGDYKGFLNYGDRIRMFNNLYKIVSHKKQYTILEDEKNTKLALPTDKLKLLMKTGHAVNHGAINLIKSKTGTPATKSTSDFRAKPIGTISVGADGSSYKKISDNPARWAKVNEGSVHSAPGEEEEHHLSQPEFQTAHKKVLGTILSDTHKEDHPKLEKMLDEWLKAKKKASHYQLEANTSEVDAKGKKLPKVAPGSKVQVHSQLERVALEKHAALKEALRQSAIKKKTGSEPVSSSVEEKIKPNPDKRGSDIKLNYSEMREILDKGDYAIVSAGKNPKLEKDMTPEQAAKRHEQLKREIRSMGYKYIEGKGNYDGEEDSLIVLGMSKEDSKKLGKKFNQDSVIHSEKGKHKMHFTTGENEGKHHKGEGWEEKPSADNYYTNIKTADGKNLKFALNFDFDKMDSR